jgi:hypothetical protein
MFGPVYAMFGLVSGGHMDYCVYVCANLCFGILGICACFKIETMFSRLHIRRESQNRVYIFLKKIIIITTWAKPTFPSVIFFL